MRQIRTSSSMSGRWKRACSLQAPRHLSTLLRVIDEDKKCRLTWRSSLRSPPFVRPHAGLFIFNGACIALDLEISEQS